MMPYKDPEKKKEYSKQYYQKNKEKILERTRNYRQENLEKSKERNRKYYYEHKDEKIAYNKKWAKENLEKRREYVKRWEKKNPKYSFKNRLMINGKMVTVRKRPYEGYCEMCGKEVETKAINWHHWDDERPEYGLWLDFFCHGAAEAHEQNGIKVPKYEEMKQMIMENNIKRIVI